MGGKRKREEITNPYAFVLAGPLRDELRTHAYGRCRHFFYYVFTCKVLADLVGFTPWNAVQERATHQLDTGFRSTHAAHLDFDPADAKVVDRSCSGFRNTDAAHYCNLGIVASEQSRIATRAVTDPRVKRFYEHFEIFCADTRRLPQQVNIGPDRVVDRFHYAHAMSILRSPGPCASPAHLKSYLSGAIAAMNLYISEQKSRGNLGLAACAEAYIRCWTSDEDALWSLIGRALRLECEAETAGLDPRRYVAI